MSIGKALLFALVVFVVVALVLFGLGIVGRGAETATEMADQTVFNASKHVYSYEEFLRKKSAYDQYVAQQTEAETRLAELKKVGTNSGQEYDNLVMEISGIRNMRRRIAAEYNAMSQTSYKAVWKANGLPDRLE